MSSTHPHPARVRRGAVVAVLAVALALAILPALAGADEIRRLSGTGSLHPALFFDLLDAAKGGDLGRVLLVDDDDNAPDVRAAYTDALDDLGIDYDVWDTGNSDVMEPSAATLAAYGAVVWFSGAAFVDPPPGVAGPGLAGEAALDAYLESGGCFLLSSQDYIFDHAEGGLTAFMTDRLGLDSVVEDVSHISVTGAGPFAGIGPSALDFPFENLSDELEPDATAAVAFFGEQAPLRGAPSEAPVALAKVDGAARASFWGFPFEALPVADRGPALAAFFAWCASDPDPGGTDPTLTVVKSGSGTGRVTSAPPGIDCGADCGEAYPPGTEVTLTAAADPASTFTGWSGGGCTGTGPCTLTLASDTTVTAAFAAEDPGFAPTLTVRRIGAGTGTVTSAPAGIDCGADCAETYPPGTRVRLTAVPDAGSVFTGWSGGGCAGTGVCDLTLVSDTAVAAAFAPDGSAPALTVRRIGNGTGTVASAPPGIDCGLDCSETYAPGAPVLLTATADPGSTFAGWSGGGCSGTGACAVILTSARAVTAKFTRRGSYPTLTVSTAGTGLGAVFSAPGGIICGSDCSQTYAPETVIRLTAVPAVGSRFAGWAGDCGGINCAVPLTTYNKSVFAIFEEAPEEPCPGAICLAGERFAVDVAWRTPGGRTGAATAVPFRSEDAGILWFFTENNWEMLIKVLDGCSLTGHFWVFAAASTDVEYTLTVTDRVSGRAKSYFNPQGSAAASIADTRALAVCGADASRAPERSTATPPLEPAPELAKQGGCIPGPTTLCLGQGRFAVEVDWRTAAGGTGSGRAVPFASEESGIFYFFTENNWEMLVKVLDGCGVNQRYWVFAAATTDAGYRLRITDTEAGEVREYSNPVGRAAPAITDGLAFATCP